MHTRTAKSVVIISFNVHLRHPPQHDWLWEAGTGCVLFSMTVPVLMCVPIMLQYAYR